MVRQARLNMHEVTGGPFQSRQLSMGCSVGMPVPSMTMASISFNSRDFRASELLSALKL